MSKAVRELYEEFGVDEYYKQNASMYQNPHESIAASLIETAKQRGLIGKKVLDLCCGTGEITRMLPEHEVVGVDPYTYRVYTERTGKRSHAWSFVDISCGRIIEKFDTIVCSFALHLCPKSLLPNVLWNLGLVSNRLIVISPNKNPDCHGISGWKQAEETMIDRVRMRVYTR